MASRSPESDGLEARILRQAQDEVIHARSRLASILERAIPLGLAALGIGATLVAQTADRARTEGLAQRVSERLQALQREADTLAAQEKTLLGELRGFEIQRQMRSEELRQLDRESAQVEKDL